MYSYNYFKYICVFIYICICVHTCTYVYIYVMYTYESFPVNCEMITKTNFASCQARKTKINTHNQQIMMCRPHGLFFFLIPNSKLANTYEWLLVVTTAATGQKAHGWGKLFTLVLILMFIFFKITNSADESALFFQERAEKSLFWVD